MAVKRVDRILRFSALSTDVLPTLLPGFVGSTVFLEDTNAYKRWDGENWLDYAALGGAGGSGGPAPNTVLLSTAYGARHEGSHNVIIPRITADDANNPNRKVPIPTDRVSVEGGDAIIIGVEQPAGRDFTVLTLDDALGVEVERNEPIRIDRLKYADVESGTADGGLLGPTGNTQASVSVTGAGGANFMLTLKSPFANMLGAGGNGVRLTFEIADSAAGYFYYEVSTRHMIVRRSTAFDIGSFRNFLIEHAGTYLTVGALNGSNNVALSSTTWAFQNGISATLGATEVTLHNVRNNVQVGDSIQFSDQAGAPRREITEVEHTASSTRLTFSPPLTFAYANDAAIVVERPSGYAESVVAVKGPKGDDGDDGEDGEDGQDGVGGGGPPLSDTAPGNTPGSPSAGTSAEAARADHDHGITPGAGGGDAREFARTNAVMFAGSGNPEVTPSSTNNGRIWNYTGDGTPTINFLDAAAENGTWRAMLAHTGDGGVVTVQGNGVTLATVRNGESGIAIFRGDRRTWAFVFVGKNPSTISQAQAEAGTNEDVHSWTAQRVAQAIAALAPSGGGGTPFVLTDDAVLDLGAENRAEIDRGKALGVNALDENAVALLTIPKVPSAPANESEAKKYELNVPATNGDPSWVEAAAGGGGGGTGTGIEGALVAVATGFGTGQQNEAASIGGLTWTKADSTPSWFKGVGTTFRAGYPGKNDETGIPTNADGFLFRAFVNTAATGQPAVWEQRGAPAKFAFGINRSTSTFRRIIQVSATQRFGIQEEQITAGADNGLLAWRCIGNGTTLPANMQLRMYWSLAGGGAQGERGPQGPGYGPVYFFWANGATERVTLDLPYTQDAAADNRLRLQFKTNGPDERVHVADGPATWFVAGSEVANLDTGGNPVAATDRVVFQPPAGTWKFKLFAGIGNAGSATSNSGIGLFEIKTGVDDTIIAESTGQALSANLFGFTEKNISVVESDEVVTDGTRQFYWMAMTQDSAPARVANWSFYMRAEKVL